MIRLFRPQIEVLLRERDSAIAKWRKQHPSRDVFEDRELGLPSSMEISVDDQIRAIGLALANGWGLTNDPAGLIDA